MCHAKWNLFGTSNMYLTIAQNLTRYPKWNLISYGQILIYISTKDE